MPQSKKTVEQIQDDAENLFVEQARAYYRDMRTVAENAPLGKIIDRARWSEARVARMGVICALRYSDQWDDYWKQAN